MAPTNEKHDDDLVSSSVKELFLNLLEENGITIKTVDFQAGSIRGDNYLGVIAKAEVMGRDGEGKEISDSYIIKSAPRSEGLRKIAPIHLAYEREIYIYSVVLPEFERFQKEKQIKNVFDSYAKYLRCSTKEKDEALIMKDMKALGYKMQNRKQALDYPHVKLVIHELARLHSLSFALRDQHPELFDELESKMHKNYFSEMDLKDWKPHADKQCEKACNALHPDKDQKAIERFQIFREYYIDHLTSLLEDQCHPYSVIRHGDSWTNNFLFAYQNKSKPEEPTNLCFLDWQLAHVGPPALDLLYFIYSCTDKKVRDEHFDQLIKDYYQTLKEFTKELGTDLENHYSYSILMDQMKKFGKFGLCIAIMILHLLLSDSDEIPDMNEIFEDPEKMFDAFSSFESKNVEAFNLRIRDVILHSVEKEYI